MTSEQFIWQDPGAWRKPCIVHVTIVAHNRQPLFGTLCHNGNFAEVEKTPLGWVLINEQKHLLQLCPEIRILADKVMPDHHHIVLQVTKTMFHSVKEVIRGYMQGCKITAKAQGYTEPLFDGAPYFRVLTHRGQLNAMIQYVNANAERAWIKKENPNLFRLHRETKYSVYSPKLHSEPFSMQFSSLGNHWLLDWPDKQIIEMSRSASEEQITDCMKQALTVARNGAVTITAAISKGEKRIARAIREAGYPLIVLLTDGFPKNGSESERYYKPGGVYFEACAAGRLLLLEATKETLCLPQVVDETQNALKRKAEQKHLQYIPILRDSKRWIFVANNEIGRMLAIERETGDGGSESEHEMLGKKT